MMAWPGHMVSGGGDVANSPRLPRRGEDVGA